MYDNLKSLGITNPDEIDRYSLRQEANNDILKIYFHKDKVSEYALLDNRSDSFPFCFPST